VAWVTYTSRKQPDNGARYQVKYLSECRVKDLKIESHLAGR
jgi:hypothetical protein